MKALLTSFFYDQKFYLLIFSFALSTAAYSSITITDQTCICNGDGTIELTIEPDQGYVSAGPFSFEWSGPNGYTSTMEDPNDLKDPGLYYVTVTDAFGCKKELNTEVQNCITIELESLICYCPGDGFGVVDVTVSSEFQDSDLSFVWEGPDVMGQSSEDVKVQDEGLYTLTVVDSQWGCTAEFEIYVPECNFDIGNYYQITPDCNDEGTSTISLQIPSGIGLAPYHITWIKLGGGVIEVDETLTGEADVNNLSAGEYCVTVLTSNGCQEQKCGLVVQASPVPTINSEVTPIATGGDGMIALTASGGVGTTTYLWQDGSTLPFLSNLNEGTYTVTVTSNNGACEEVLSFELLGCGDLSSIGQPEAIITPLTGGQSNNASIDIINMGDAYPGYNFIFDWNTGFADTEDISNLIAGVYCVDVTVEECDFVPLSDCFTICDYSINFSKGQSTCSATNLTVEALPINNTYSYQWSTGSTQQTISAFYGTEYCVAIVDGSGCTAEACITPELDPLEISADITNSTFGNNDGSITITPEGGISPYSYLWDDGTTGTTILNLGVDTYCVTVTDACNNMVEGCFTIQCEFGESDLLADVTDVTCDTGSGELGSIVITKLPDVPNGLFDFQWSTGETTQEIKELVVGTYCVTVTEVNTGCHAVSCFEIATDGKESFDLSFARETSCFPLNEGQLTVIPSNNVSGPFTYNWAPALTNGPKQLGHTATITNLLSGFYFVTVTDNRGCTADEITFLGFSRPEFDIEATAGLACIGGVGNVEIAISEGAPTGPLRYSVLGMPNTATYQPVIEGLPKGPYIIVGTDNEGCEARDFTEIVESTEIIIEESIRHNCLLPGWLSARITLPSISGGQGPYTVDWCCGGNQSGNGYFDLSGGNYSVTVTDFNGCSTEENYFLAESNPPVVQSTITPASCTCCTDGTISLSISGDYSPYEVRFDDEYYTVNSLFYANNLELGDHYWWVEDLYGCRNEFTFTHFMTESALPAIQIDVVQVLPQTSSHWGSIDIEVIGGQAPYTYAWSDAGWATTQDRNTLWGGTYTVTVTDQFGCTETETITVCSFPDPFNYQLPETYPVGYVVPCMNGNNGWMKVPEPLEEHGGSAPYTYQWSGPGGFTANGQHIFGLTEEGEYCVTITDACGLTASYCQDFRCDNCQLSWSGFIGDCTFKEDGTIHVEKIFGFPNHDYFIDWPESYGGVSRVHTDSDNKVHVDEGTSKIKIKQGLNTTVCFEVVDAVWGCSVPQCVIFTSEEKGGYAVFETLYEFDQHGYEADYAVIDALINAGYNYPMPYGYIHRIGVGTPCRPTDDDHDSYVLEFSPYSSVNPCWQGGKINNSGITVPLSSQGVQIIAGGESYCLWAPGVLTGDDSFIKLADKTIESQYFPQEPYTNFVVPDNPSTPSPADPYEAAVIAKVYYPTEGPGGGGNGLPGGAGNGENPVVGECDGLNNPCGLETPCIFVTEDDCTYSVYCNEEDIGNSELVVGNVPGLLSLCYKNAPNTGGCQIVFQCSINDCDLIHVASSAFGDKFIYYNELVDGINQLPIDELVVAEAVLSSLIDSNCGGDGECSCEEISQVIGECFACFGGNDNEVNLVANTPNLNSGQIGTSPTLGKSTVEVYPNPFNDELNIEIVQEQSRFVEVSIVNLLGEKLWGKKVSLENGKNILTWNPGYSLANGIYYVRLLDDAGKQTTKKVVYSNRN